MSVFVRKVPFRTSRYSIFCKRILALSSRIAFHPDSCCIIRTIYLVYADQDYEASPRSRKLWFESCLDKCIWIMPRVLVIAGPRVFVPKERGGDEIKCFDSFRCLSIFINCAVLLIAHQHFATALGGMRWVPRARDIVFSDQECEEEMLEKDVYLQYLRPERNSTSHRAN